MSYIGDFALGDTFDTKFCTVNTSGVPTTLAGTPAISAYVGNSVTEITAGITLTVDFDARTGLHNVRVVATSGNGYATASNYQLVITAGTVGGSSVVGYVVAEFSIEARSALRPTTAARTLDVSAGGEAGLDWANIGSPTTAQNLSATNIDVDQVVASVSGAVGSVTGAVGSVTTVTSIVNGVWNEDATGHQTLGTFGQAIGDPVADTNTIYKAVVTDAAGATVGVDVVAVQADTDDIQARLPAALVGGRMDASVGAMAADVVTAAAIATDAIGSLEFSQAAADKVWSSATRTLTAFSTTLALSVWDVLETAILTASSIGIKLKNNLDVVLSTRATPAQVNTEVVDALNVDTYGEPGQEAPGVTVPLTTKVGYLYKFLRNRITATATTISVYNDDATTVAQKSTHSDDATTYDRGEFVSGP